MIGLSDDPKLRAVVGVCIVFEGFRTIDGNTNMNLEFPFPGFSGNNFPTFFEFFIYLMIRNMRNFPASS
jgi:hypothetical protein